jgi:hypothetical protein
MRAGTRPLTWLLAMLCLAALGSCRRVTIISFYADTPAPTTDSLIINLHGFGMKRSVQLGGMDEQLGLYDVHGDPIYISAFGCAAATDGSDYITSINMMNGQRPPIAYSIGSDAVLVHMVAYPANPRIPCPRVEHDGGVSGEPSGTGGAAGMGSGGGAAGAGSGGMSGGGGTDGGIDTAGGAGGTGGADAGAGSGGNTGVGGCDDAGHTEIDAGACQAPDPSTAQPPRDVTPNDPCVAYCARIIGPRDGGPVLCPGTYPDVTTCERYCTLAALPAGATSDSGDTLGCRAHYLMMAEMSTGTAHTTACTSAGPTGIGPSPGQTGGCGSGPCATFCDAWAAICSNGNPADCMTACTSATDAACRFDWLMRTATVDARYCDLVAFTSTCIVPGCPGL